MNMLNYKYLVASQLTPQVVNLKNTLKGLKLSLTLLDYYLLIYCNRLSYEERETFDNTVSVLLPKLRLDLTLPSEDQKDIIISTLYRMYYYVYEYYERYLFMPYHYPLKSLVYTGQYMYASHYLKEVLSSGDLIFTIDTDYTV